MVPVRFKNIEHQKIYQIFIWGIILGFICGMLTTCSMRHNLIEKNIQLRIQNKQMLSTLIKVRQHLEGNKNESIKTDEQTATNTVENRTTK